MEAPAPFYTLSPEEKSKAVKRLCKEVVKLLVAAGGGTTIGGWIAWRLAVWTIRTQAALLAQLIGVPVGIATVVVMGLNSIRQRELDRRLEEELRAELHAALEN